MLGTLREIRKIRRIIPFLQLLGPADLFRMGVQEPLLELAREWVLRHKSVALWPHIDFYLTPSRATADGVMLVHRFVRIRRARTAALSTNITHKFLSNGRGC
jgi:hypothetical protein